MNRFLSLAALALGVLVLARPQAAASGFADGIALCLSAVLPVLFPFFVVCELLIGSRLMSVLAKPLRWLCRIAGLRTPAAPAFLLLSWLGGYAASAQTLGQMSRRLPRREAALLMVLGCCSGPGFVIGCVGGLLLGSVRLGILLYAAQLAANWIGAAAAVPFLPSAKQAAPLCSCCRQQPQCLRLCCILSAPFLSCECRSVPDRRAGDQRRLQRICRARRTVYTVWVLLLSEHPESFRLVSDHFTFEGQGPASSAGCFPRSSSCCVCGAGPFLCAVAPGCGNGIFFPDRTCYSLYENACRRRRDQRNLSVCGSLQGKKKDL